MVVCIYELTGKNYLEDVIDFGPAWYKAKRVGGKLEAVRTGMQDPGTSAAADLSRLCGWSHRVPELLHYGQRTVHGEIRGKRST